MAWSLAFKRGGSQSETQSYAERLVERGWWGDAFPTKLPLREASLRRIFAFLCSW
ncbi:hypothetical protein [Brunnivagina elsteri]|uniref:hypothetical protein n=1 Tax=Brunnivagina elsteri TaxID=1247191 RepID=UPI0013041FBF|nr:hypothetical protein [Calothrix elsteri]